MIQATIAFVLSGSCLQKKEGGELDDDMIKESPAFVPVSEWETRMRVKRARFQKAGVFYMHDHRSAGAVGDNDAAPTEEPTREKRQTRADVSRWHHDLFDERQQQPKSGRDHERQNGSGGGARRSGGDGGRMERQRGGGLRSDDDRRPRGGGAARGGNARAGGSRTGYSQQPQQQQPHDTNARSSGGRGRFGRRQPPPSRHHDAYENVNRRESFGVASVGKLQFAGDDEYERPPQRARTFTRGVMAAVQQASGRSQNYGDRRPPRNDERAAPTAAAVATAAAASSNVGASWSDDESGAQPDWTKSGSKGADWADGSCPDWGDDTTPAQYNAAAESVAAGFPALDKAEPLQRREPRATRQNQRVGGGAGRHNAELAAPRPSATQLPMQQQQQPPPPPPPQRHLAMQPAPPLNVSNRALSSSTLGVVVVAASLQNARYDAPPLPPQPPRTVQPIMCAGVPPLPTGAPMLPPPQMLVSMVPPPSNYHQPPLGTVYFDAAQPSSAPVPREFLRRERRPIEFTSPQ